MKSRLAITLVIASAPVYAQPAPSSPAAPTDSPSEPVPAGDGTGSATPTTVAAAAPAEAPTATAPTATAATGAASLTDVVGISASTTPESNKPKPVELKPGGYLQADSRSFADDSGTRDLTLRRLRFKLEGKAFKYFKLNTLIDTAGSKLQVLNAWVELAPRPELSIRVGKDKNQFGIERLQSATDLTFVERAYPTQIAPNRDIGVALRGDIAGGLVHYSAALVDGVADNAVIEGETDDALEYNLHLLISPLKKLDPDIDLGIGAATTFGRTHGTLTNPGIAAIKSPGQATIVKWAGGGASDTMATTALGDGYRTRYAAHGYIYAGPVGALAEYVRDNEPVALGGNHTLVGNQAWQLASSLALTAGDRPSYKSIQPKKNFDPEAGTWGAVEVALRYAELRIDKEAFDAGVISASSSVQRARSGTLGINWYFNKSFKLQLDYEGTTYKGGAQDGNRPTEHLISTRLQAAI